MIKSELIKQLVGIEDELRDAYQKAHFVYLDAHRDHANIDFVNFSDALAHADFYLDALANSIDQLQQEVLK